jgi:hypothetical protein
MLLTLIQGRVVLVFALRKRSLEFIQEEKKNTMLEGSSLLILSKVYRSGAISWMGGLFM